MEGREQKINKRERPAEEREAMSVGYWAHEVVGVGLRESNLRFVVHWCPPAAKLESNSGGDPFGSHITVSTVR